MPENTSSRLTGIIDFWIKSNQAAGINLQLLNRIVNDSVDLLKVTDSVEASKQLGKLIENSAQTRSILGGVLFVIEAIDSDGNKRQEFQVKKLGPYVYLSYTNKPTGEVPVVSDDDDPTESSLAQSRLHIAKNRGDEKFLPLVECLANSWTLNFVLPDTPSQTEA